MEPDALCFRVDAELDALESTGYTLTKCLTTRLLEAKLARATALVEARERQHIELLYSCKKQKK